MAIHLSIRNARVQAADDSKPNTRWWVLHPSNDAILATCDEQEEAQALVQLMNELSETANDPMVKSVVALKRSRGLLP